jgi:hypothetical protein
MRFDEDMGYGLVDTNQMAGGLDTSKIDFSSAEFAKITPPLTVSDKKWIQSELSPLSSPETYDQWVAFKTGKLGADPDPKATPRLLAAAEIAFDQLAPPVSVLQFGLRGPVFQAAPKATPVASTGTKASGLPQSGAAAPSSAAIGASSAAQPSVVRGVAPAAAVAARQDAFTFQKSDQPPPPVFATPEQAQAWLQQQDLKTQAGVIWTEILWALLPFVDTAQTDAALDAFEQTKKDEFAAVMADYNNAKTSAAYFNGMTDSLNTALQDAAIFMLADLSKGQDVYAKLQEGWQSVTGKAAWKARTGSSDNNTIPDHAFTWYYNPEDKSTNYWAVPLVTQQDGMRDAQSGQTITGTVIDEFKYSLFSLVWAQGGSKKGIQIADGATDPYPPWQTWLQFPLQLPNKQIKHPGTDKITPSVVGILSAIPQVRAQVAAALALLVKQGRIPQGKVLPLDTTFAPGVDAGFLTPMQVPGSEWITSWNNSSDKYYRSLSPEHWQFLLAFPYNDQQAQEVCKNPGSPDGNPLAPTPIYITGGVKYPAGFPASYAKFVTAATQFFTNEFNKSKCWASLHGKQVVELYQKQFDADMAWLKEQRDLNAKIKSGALTQDQQVASIMASVQKNYPDLAAFAAKVVELTKEVLTFKPQSNYSPADLLPVGPLPKLAQIDLGWLGANNNKKIVELEQVAEKMKAAKSPAEAPVQVLKQLVYDLRQHGADFMANAAANDLTVAKGWQPVEAAVEFRKQNDFPNVPAELKKYGIFSLQPFDSILDPCTEQPPVAEFQKTADRFKDLQQRYDAVIKNWGKAADEASVYDGSENTPPPSNGDNSAPPDANNEVIIKKTSTETTTTTAPAGPNWLLLLAAGAAAVAGAPVLVPAALGAVALLSGKKADDAQG